MEIITAIIPHYFDNRVDSLRQAVAILRPQVKEVIVWNNGERPLKVDGARVLHSPCNVGPVARFWAVPTVTHTTGYVFFQDNDLMIQSDTIREMSYWASKYPRTVLSLHGYDIPLGGSYAKRKFVLNVPKPQRVNVTLGRAELVPYWAAELALRGMEGTAFARMDDLWFSHRLHQLDIPIWVVPGRMTNLAGWNEGASAERDHYKERERLYPLLFPKEVSDVRIG